MGESEFRVAAVYVRTYYGFQTAPHANTIQLTASIPAALLEAMIGGNLCIAARSNDDIDNLLYDSKSMWRIRANDKKAPGIYIWNLAVKEGNAPTTCAPSLCGWRSYKTADERQL